jgi:hypothetical protein
MKHLTDSELCTQMSGAWKYFYNMQTSGMFSKLGELTVDLQTLLQSYNTECKRRGIKSVPHTETISGNVVPEMSFERI